MSELEVSLTQKEMEESGEMDFIRQHVEAANSEGETAPAEEADTVVTEEDAVEEQEEVVEEGTESPESDESDQEDTTLTAEEEEVLYLELDDATQNLIDSKYGGDINKALAALNESQSLIGRQGSELGDLRKQMEDLTQAVRQNQAMSQPYPDWPDEFADEQDAAMQYRSIAEAAFERGDVDMFTRAVDTWEESNAIMASTYRDLKILQLQTSLAQAPAAKAPEDTLIAEGIDGLKVKYPQFTSEVFQAELGKELEKFPSLKGLLWGEIPGTTPEQRLAALEETIVRVASRHTADTEQQARRRVAVKTSEEARAARREAQVSRGESARVVEVEPEGRTIPMGETGRSLDIDRLNAMLPAEDRI